MKITLADLEAFDARASRGRVERVCRCPICQSDERAFHFNIETGAFNCKRASCGARGKLADFWEDRPPLNRRQRARSALHAAFGLESPLSSQKPSQCMASAQKSAPATAAIWQSVYSRSRPITGTPASRYLLDQRGLSKAISEVAGVRAVSLWSHDWGRVRDCALFPFGDSEGTLVAFQARAIDAAPDGHRAYGLKNAGVFLASSQALKSETVILCEAPIDALSVAACGITAVALGGVVSPQWLPRVLAFKRVLLAFDNDANGAGDKAALELAPDLHSLGAKVARLSPPREEGQSKSDWNAMLLQHGTAVMRSWLMARLEHIRRFEFGD